MTTRCLLRPVAGLLALAALSSSIPFTAGCGKKGPPLAPLRRTPARVEDLTIRRFGDDVQLQFTIPDKNSDGSTPADLSRMEAVAITGYPQDPAGRPLEARDFLKLGAVVGSIQVAPPPPPPPPDGPPPPPPPPDPRPAQGTRATIVEHLTPAAQTPFVHPRQAEFDAARLKARALEPEARDVWPLAPPAYDPPARVYVVAGLSTHGQAGPLSARLRVPLTLPPDAPAAPTLQYDEKRIIVEWQPPPTARRKPEAIATATDASGGAGTVLEPIAGRPLFEVPVPHTYNVYEPVSPDAAAKGAVPVPSPLNPTPLDTLTFEDSRLAFGIERCYVVRTVEADGPVTLESAPSPPACVTPRDIFPPPAPRNLAAVGAEGAINLIWETSDAPDLAGYIVLRGEAPGAKLEALTPTPIKESTYRDATVQAGVRYVYAVVAADTAVPQNVSVESNRVEETAR